MRIQSKEVVLGKVADLFSSQDYDEQELYNLFLLLVKDPTLNHNDHETIKVLSFIADSFKNIQRRVEAVTISSLWAKPNSFFEVKFIPKWDENVCMLNDVEERLRLIKDVLLKTHSNTALESRAVAMWSQEIDLLDSTNKKLDYIYDGLTQKPYSAWIKAGLDKWSDVVDELPEEEREKEVDKLVSNNNIELARAAKFKKAEMTQETTNMDKVSPMSVSSFASKFKIKD